MSSVDVREWMLLDIRSLQAIIEMLLDPQDPDDRQGYPKVCEAWDDLERFREKITK